MKKLMLLNIQLFAEEAANESEIDNELPIEEDVVIADNDVEFDDEPIDKTKAFASRLKEKTAEIERKAIETVKQEKDKIARLKGYSDWDTYEKAVQDDKIMELGVEDPEQLTKIINDIVSNNPEVLRAKQILEEQSKAEQQKMLDKEIDLIKGYNDQIKSIDDIIGLPNYQEIYDKVKQGYKLSDAYLICNLSSINLEKINKAKQEAVINANSKNHMKTTSGRPDNTVTVPSEVYAIYKHNFPNWDEAKIKEDYAKRLKG